MDSIVLLHALSELKKQSKLDFEFRALHVNHGLQQEAEQWQEHCEQICRQLCVGFTSVSVSVDINIGSVSGGNSNSTAGLENAAREARYEAFQQELKAGEVLLLAHHKDDQMETLLLRLMRGSGSRGLSSIPRSRTVGEGHLLRPLLDFTLAELQQYADEQQLQWVQDPSNQDQRFDRNFCRHSLLPMIETRWPGYRDSWSKTITLAEESETLLCDLARIDLINVETESKSVLRVDKLLLLSNARRRNVLRYWLALLELPELGWNLLQQLAGEILLAEEGALLVCPGFQLRSFKGCVHALTQMDDFRPKESQKSRLWNISETKQIELTDNGSLNTQAVNGKGLSLINISHLQIKYRQGGEFMRLAGRPGKSLKKIFQESGVEPWLRNRIPLLYVNDQLVCIPDLGCSEEYVARAGEPGLIISWTRPGLEVS